VYQVSGDNRVIDRNYVDYDIYYHDWFSRQCIVLLTRNYMPLKLCKIER